MNIEKSDELTPYLIDQGILSEEVGLVSKMLSGGVSNRTVKIDFNGHSWVIKQALPKLRVKGEWYSAPDRIYHEAAAIRWLEQYMPGTCPKLTFEDKPNFIMAMQAVSPPFQNLKDLFMNSAPLNEHFTKAGRILGEMHALGLDRERVPELFFDTGFFESLRIDPYYGECQKRVEQTREFFDQLIRETRADAYTFTHGDFSPKNLLVKNNQLILLDHEVAHFGDGTFDLGFFIAHLFSKANHLKSYRNDFLEGINQFFAAYLEFPVSMSTLREQRAVKHAIGCILARVRGLSQLEYLNDLQRERQLLTGLTLTASTPGTITQLVTRFRELL
jgi:5-methylthioribose kinase